MAQNAKHVKKAVKDETENEEVIKSREPTPKLIRTVIQVITLHSSNNNNNKVYLL